MGLRLIVILMLISAMGGFSQGNFNKIDLQGQFIDRVEGITSLECLVLSADEDTIWRESHASVSIDVAGMFALDVGTGVFISGEYDSFELINWNFVQRFELYETDVERVLMGNYGVTAVPYAFHSRTVESIPLVIGLHDTPAVNPEEGDVIRFNGDSYEWSSDSLYTDPFADKADTVAYADTVWFAFNDRYADSTLYALFADTNNYAWQTQHSFYGDTAIVADSAGVGLFSMGNWGIKGNYATVDSNFVGTTNEDSLVLRTNNAPRIIIADSSFHNNTPAKGLGWASNKGLLVTPNDLAAPTLFEGSHILFDGNRALFHGGRSDTSFDTLTGQYSFAFGENVGTNGTYSAVFGNNTYGDTAYFGGSVPYAAISSFAVGRNCRVTHMGLAIGDSAISGYYRNIAIGHNVIATNKSAGTAIGDNVLVTGATAWAMGKNLTSDGSFSTAMGSNAGNGGYLGSFVYGDASTSDTVYNTSSNQFMVRADGGYVFYSSSDLTSGVELLTGAGSWTMISDRNKKMNIVRVVPLKYRSVFDSLTVYTWNYLGNETEHVGAMAQDIYRLYKVGEKPYLINMIDSDGITFLGIQMLHESINELELLKEDSLNPELENEQESLDELEQRINALYEELDNN